MGSKGGKDSDIEKQEIDDIAIDVGGDQASSKKSN